MLDLIYVGNSQLGILSYILIVKILYSMIFIIERDFNRQTFVFKHTAVAGPAKLIDVKSYCDKVAWK